MTIIDAKECMNRYRDAKRDLQRVEAKRHELEEQMSMLRGVEYDGIHVKGGIYSPDKIGEQIARHEEMLRMCDRARDELYRVLDEVTNLIDRVPDSRYRMILTDRYISLLRWEEIENRRNYGRASVYRLHGEALMEIKKLLEDETK